MNRSAAATGAKLPGGGSGIEIRHTMCDICSPGAQCGIDAYVKDGVVVKVEGTKGFMPSNGKLCTKGAANRQYIYRQDRLKTPLRRTGPRGSGQYEPVSWDEALQTAADAFNRVKAQHGPEAVVWMAGYSKWFRPWLHRLAHTFGSRNYITESSTCHQGEVMSNLSLYGHTFMMPDLRNAKMAMLWGSNSVMNSYLMGRGVFGIKDNGGQIVVIDPRLTHVSQKLADLYLRPKIGTDGALAHAMAKILIEEDLIDRPFIEAYVHGFEPYSAYVRQFDLAKTEAITDVPKADIVRAVEMFMAQDPATIVPGNGLTHRTNGYNNHRAVLSLLAITGRVDRPGTVFPEQETLCHSNGGFPGLEAEYINANRPLDCKIPVGHGRFPLWADMVDECQGMDLLRHIETADPYPIRAAACFGVNDRMYPESPRFMAALDSLDFVLATDIFETDVCAHADIVLPVSTSFERSEAKCYAGQFVNWTRPVIAPVHDNRDDVSIIAELARRMQLGDTLLEKGYDAGAEFMLQNSGITDWEAVKDAPLPTRAPNAKPYVPGSYLKNIKTPTGKIELYSEAVARHSGRGLEPLPVYLPSDDSADPAAFPLVLMAGARLPHTIHSRGHGVPWLRSLRPHPSVDINPADAAALGIREGDDIRLETTVGHIRARAHLTELSNLGEVGMYHGYKEANINSIIPAAHLDPYTGFPGYKQVRCRVEKA